MRPQPIKWAVSLHGDYIWSLLFLRGLRGYVWVDMMLTLLLIKVYRYVVLKHDHMFHRTGLLTEAQVRGSYIYATCA